MMVHKKTVVKNIKATDLQLTQKRTREGGGMSPWKTEVMAKERGNAISNWLKEKVQYVVYFIEPFCRLIYAQILL